MADPAVYDLSYRTNIGGLFLPPEYISNFTIGEDLELVRLIAHSPKQIVSVQFITKRSKLPGSPVVVSKLVTTVLDADGVVLQDADGSWLLTLLFQPVDTLKFDSKLHFVVEVNFDDGTSMVASQGYIQGQLNETGTSGIPVRIAILNAPASTGLGQLQMLAAAYDSLNNVLDTVAILWFTSNPLLAQISDTGLVNAVAVTGPSGVIITAATTQGNLATRATLVIS